MECKTISLAPLTLIICCALPGKITAATVPFTEDFTADSANWYNNASASPVGWSSSGGPDGGSYATTSFSFVASSPGDTPALFRCHTNFNSSGGAFAGNWITDGVQRIHFQVRHDAGVDVTFFVRYADPANFPGAVTVFSRVVSSGVWTPLTVAIPHDGMVFEGPGFADVFDNIGRIQLGVLAPTPLIGVNQPVTFDLDKFSILANVPAASTWGLVALALLICTAATLMLRKTEGQRLACS